MSFDPTKPATYPRIGEVLRCRRCLRTWHAVECCSCGGAKLVSPQVLGIDKEHSARAVADTTSEFCPRCINPDEEAAVAMSAALGHAPVVN